MKLRLPILLLSVVMAAYSQVSAASFDLNGADNSQELSLSDGESLTNSSLTDGTQSGLLTLEGDVLFGGTGNYTISGGIAGAGTVTLNGKNTVTVNKGNSAYAGNWTVAADTTLAVKVGDALTASLGTGSVTLAGGILKVEVDGGRTSFNNQIVLAGDSTLQTKNRPRIAVGGKIIGEGNLTVEADGETELHGFVTNRDDTFTGSVIIRKGTVRIGSGTGTGVLPEGDYWLGTGDVLVEGGAVMHMWLNNNGNAKVHGIMNGVTVKDGGKIHSDSGNYNFKGDMTWEEGATAAISMNWSGKIDVQGVLGGSGVINVQTASVSGGGSLSLSNNNNTFSGALNLLNNANGITFTVELKEENAAKNIDINLLGNESNNNSKSILKVSSARSVISSLQGNTKAQVTAGTAGNTLVIANGGDYQGTFGVGVSIENNGVLKLGNTTGVAVDKISGTGTIHVGTGYSLTLNGASSSSALVLDGGSLTVNGGATAFGGLQLANGSSSSITVGTGSSLTTGAITGSGSLLLSGTDSITGSIAADHLFSITFQQGNEFYNAKVSGGNIIKGDVFGDLLSNSNDGSKSFTFRNGADLTMNNGAGTLYTIGNLAASGTGKTLTLGAGGLKINGALTYTNAESEIMTVGGGALQMGSLLKKGAGGMLFNSQVTTGELSVEGSITFANGGSVAGRLSGGGTLNVQGGAGKVFSVGSGGSSESFTGALNISGGSRMQMNGAGTTTLSGVSGAGTLEVNAGTVNIKGVLTTVPEGSDGDISKFTGTALSIGAGASVMVDHTALTADGLVDLPYASRTLVGLTGTGTLVLNTVGGKATGAGAADSQGTFVYVGDAGFTGTIIVKKGFLAFRHGNLGDAHIVLDGGGLGHGAKWSGSGKSKAMELKNSIEIGDGGTILRAYTYDTLTLSGKMTGSGEFKRVDSGSLTFSGDMSGFTGNFSFANGSGTQTTTFSGTTSMGLMTLDYGTAVVNLTGKNTSLGGILHKNVKTLTIDTDVLTIGADGIKSSAASWSMAAKVGQFKASADWTLASNVALRQTAGTGFVMDTQGHDVTFEGSLEFGPGVADAGKKIVKNGAGTWILKQNGLPQGSSVAVNGGTLRYEGSGFASPVSFANGGILNFSGNQTLTKPVSGTGTIKLDAGIQLDVQGLVFNGQAGLNLNGGNKVIFSGNESGTQNMGNLTVSSAGNEILFGAAGDMILNMSDALLSAGAGLLVDGYVYSNTNYLKMNGLTAWEKLQGVTLRDKDGVEQEAMVDTRGRLVIFTEDVIVGNLVSSGVKSDGSGYTYESNTRYYGALEGKVVDFSKSFSFESGASTYGFTTRDDKETGMSAGSFTVSARLTDGDNTSRTVSILGQEGAAGRTVTFTNTANSFTGNVTVTQAVLKVQAANASSLGVAPVSILGVNNSIYLNEKAVLDLATGEGGYTYSNQFVLNGDDAVLKQTSGQHVLTGNVTLSGAGNGNRTIENTLSEGTLTLAGNLASRGGSTLILKTQGSEDSRIILSLNGDSSLNRLMVDGHVEQTKNTLSVAGGITLGNQSSWLLSGGTLAVGESLASSGGISRTITFGNGTALRSLSNRLAISPGIVLAFAHEQSSFAIDTGDGVVDFRGTLGDGTSNNTLTKKGQGTLEWGEGTTTKVNLKLEQGTLSLKENVNFSTTGDVNIQKGSVLNLEKGSSLSISPNSNFVFNGSLTGNGSLSGMNNVVFGRDARYAANMSGQSWGVVFQNGSTFSGSLLKHSGNIVFEEGSHIRFDTSLPISDKSIGISTTGGSTVRFNGAIISGSTATPDVDWDATKSYEFTLVSSQKELLGKDGKTLSVDNLGQSVMVGGDGWGAFLSGELGLSEDGKELLVTVTRNGNVISSYAQTGNQFVIGSALDYAMDNYSSLELRGTELGDVIQFFNKMGQNIAAEAPEALGMVGGLSNYQALAGQRTDMMRHLEAVRQRANAGKGLAGVSNIPDNSFWAEGTQSYSCVDGVDNSAPGYTAQTWGAAIGVDFLSGSQFSLGVAFAYSNLTVDSDQYAGQTKADNYYVDLYGRWESGNWNGVFVLSGGTADVDVKRTMSLGSETYQGKGSTDGTQIIGMAEVAYDWQWEEEGPVLQPYLGMAVGGSKLDGYTESGLGNAGLVMDEQKQTVAQASLGVRLYKQNIDREMQYETSRWELRCGLVEEFGDTDFVTRSSFIGLPGYTMSTTSDDIGRTGLQIGGGFSCAIDQAWSVFGDVNGEFRNGQTSMNSTLGLRCTF